MATNNFKNMVDSFHYELSFFSLQYNLCERCWYGLNEHMKCHQDSEKDPPN